MDERRQNNRIDTQHAGMTAHDSINGEQIGIIGNLSPGGMMLITTRELYPEGILQLTLNPPQGCGIEPISMGLKILWSSPASSPAEHWVGLETIDINAPNAAMFADLLRYLEAHH